MLSFRSRLHNHYKLISKNRLLQYRSIHITKEVLQSTPTTAYLEESIQDIDLDPITSSIEDQEQPSISRFIKENNNSLITDKDLILKFKHLQNEVYEEILNPELTRGVLSEDLPPLNDILKGHRKGELTIITGSTGCGKTTIMSQLSLDYCKNGDVPTLWGSFEILNKRLAKKMLYQFAGKNLSKYPEELEYWGDEFQKLPLYFMKYFSSTAIDEVIKACQHAVENYNIQHIILDNLQFMLSQQGNSTKDKWEIQDKAIHELRNFATSMDVHISLVVHPRKDPGERIDINSVFGSAKVTQEADNVIMIQKAGNQRYLDIQKNRYDGTTGIIPYIFMDDSLKIRPLSDEESTKYKHLKSETFTGSQSSRAIVGRANRF